MEPAPLNKPAVAVSPSLTSSKVSSGFWGVAAGGLGMSGSLGLESPMGHLYLAVVALIHDGQTVVNCVVIYPVCY